MSKGKGGKGRVTLKPVRRCSLGDRHHIHMGVVLNLQWFACRVSRSCHTLCTSRWCDRFHHFILADALQRQHHIALRSFRESHSSGQLSAKNVYPSRHVVWNYNVNFHVLYVDLRVAAVQKHDPTWGWNRLQVDLRRLGHIRLDFTWHWHVTWVDFKRLHLKNIYAFTAGQSSNLV